MATALDKLHQAKSRLCIGLDPDPALMPELFKGRMDFFFREIIQATAPFAAAFKPNLAFFEALGTEGFALLDQVLGHIPTHCLVILDGKRGDVPHTNRLYAKAMFETWGADAVTVNPYLGVRSLEPFFAYSDRLTYVLCASSNPNGLQAWEVEGEPLYLRVAREVQVLNQPHLGLVVGATQPEKLGRIRQMGACPLLLPGVGSQGGEIPPLNRGTLINVSRGILYASQGADCIERARDSAQALYDRCLAVT